MRKNFVFREIPKGEKTDPDSYFVFGWTESKLSGYDIAGNLETSYDWESYCEFSFWSFAQSYYDSAELLYREFKSAKGDNRIHDETGITICFLYRHFVELYLKYLYVKFAHPSEEDCISFLKNGHNVLGLWEKLTPVLIQRTKRYKCSSNINTVGKYIKDIDRFDHDSMKMRYPINKKLSPTSVNIRLDIDNLHNRMKELYEALEAFDNDLPKYQSPEISTEEIDSFLDKYSELKPKIISVLDSMDLEVEKESKKESHQVTSKSLIDNILNPKPSIFDSLSDDELILLDVLYYIGQDTRCCLRDPEEAKIEAVKKCVLNMKQDQVEFGKPVNTKICIREKQLSVIVKSVKSSMQIIDMNTKRTEKRE